MEGINKIDIDSVFIGEGLVIGGNIFLGGNIAVDTIRERGSGPILDVVPRQISMIVGRKAVCDHNHCYVYCDSTHPYTSNGHKTYSVLSTGRGGEGIRFNNGAEGEMYSKRYISFYF